MKKKILTKISLFAVGAVAAMGLSLNAQQMPEPKTADMAQNSMQAAQLEVATFAGGCFWCIEADFEKLPGVQDAISGYTGGQLENPSYKAVSSGSTGHTEAVQVQYDPKVISYDDLLEGFWRMFDPTDGDGSFVDRGKQYRPGIFYHNEAQKASAEAGIAKIIDSGRYDKPIAVEVTPLDVFYNAEDYHQNYHSRNPVRYKYYRFGSGRDQYLDAFWGDDLKFEIKGPVKMKAANNRQDKPLSSNHNMNQNQQEIKMNKPVYTKPSDADIRAKLTDLQYKVTQKEGTESPFTNEYNDNKKAGVYVDIVSGEPLFSSIDKYDSGTGWPSFSKPINEENVITKIDFKLIYPRKEVRSLVADSHLGHVFKDGPAPTGLRYCLNSAALRFVPKEALAEEGYGEFLALFSE